MKAVYLIVLVAFIIVLSIVEIPKMLGKEYYRELAVYSLLLLFGTAIAVMKIFSINIPNIAVVLTWVFSPLKNVLKWLTEG